jgi:ketosteroid isomerase-like protein
MLPPSLFFGRRLAGRRHPLHSPNIAFPTLTEHACGHDILARHATGGAMGRTVLLSLLALACSRVSERQRLLATDLAHSQATATQGLSTGFVAFLADDVVYLQPDVGYIRGKAAIRAFLSRVPATTKLSFRPARARVSTDGAVGYTFGWTELSSPGSAVRYGKYIAFWRKQPDGNWQVEAWNRSGGRDSAAAAPVGLPEGDDRPASARRVDVAAQARALLGADSAFAVASVARGAAAAFGEYAALHAVSLGGGKDFRLEARDGRRRAGGRSGVDGG